MTKKLKIGILHETKSPPDYRTSLTPENLLNIKKNFPETEVYVQNSDIRCYKNNEYTLNGIEVTKDISHCDVLFGVKEVDTGALIPEKTYLFFSHTTKKQPYNRSLLQEIIKKKISIIDYEHLVDENNVRIVAFGYWAGIVGSYNGIRGFLLRNKKNNIKPAHQLHDFNELKNNIKNIDLPAIKILITGEGRVASGAEEMLEILKIKQVNVNDYLTKQYEVPVYCKIGPQDYVLHHKRKNFDFEHFTESPGEYISDFSKYTKKTDIFMACHYWDPNSPKLITFEDIKEPDFKISVIADISCDLNGPVASTIRASTIEKPYYGFDKLSFTETDPFSSNVITVMAVDNLPGELPRDASKSFGDDLLEKVVPLIIHNRSHEIIKNATIVENGKLTTKYGYLKSFAEGKE